MAEKITKADLGLSNVENKSSTQIRNELTKDNVCNALGFDPISKEEVNIPYGIVKLNEEGKIEINFLPEEVKNLIPMIDYLTTEIEKLKAKIGSF